MAQSTDQKSPAKPKINAKASATEIGDTSGIAMNGIIVNDDYNSKLVGRQGVKVFTQMKDGDATVNSGVLAVNLPIKSARWYVKPGDNTRQGKKIAEFVEHELFSAGTRTWQETLDEVLDYLWFGRMPFEIVWEFRESAEFGRPMIGLRKLARRDPSSILAWKLPNGEPGVIQSTVNGRFEIPMERMLVFVNQKRGDNWEGRSLLRTAYKHWYIKDKLYLIDAISAERQGLGIPKGRTSVGARQEQKDKMEEILRNLRANEKGFVLLEGEQSDMDVEFMDMKASTVKNLMPTVQHHDRAILINILAQFLALGSTNIGSFALSKDQSGLFLLCEQAAADYICGNFDRYLIKKMVDYNFDGVTEYPCLRYDKIGNVDHNALTTSLQRAVQTGFITPQPEDEEYLRDAMELPAKSEFHEVDPAMFDEQLNELQASADGLDGSATDVAPAEDPNNPGFDMDGQPLDAPDQQASWNDAEWRRAAEAIDFVIKGGPAGQPLSEETKRKISEALKKRNSSKSTSKKTKGKKTDPVVLQKQKEIADVRKKVRDLSNEYKMKALEMKAQGKKISDQDSAKMQLELMGKKNALQSQIDQLSSDIQARKIQSATPVADKKKASDIGETIDRINTLLDGYEK